MLNARSLDPHEHVDPESASSSGEWTTASRCGYQLPDGILELDGQWVTPWCGSSEVRDFASLPVCNTGSMKHRVLYKPVKAIWTCQTGNDLSQRDLRLFNCLSYYAAALGETPKQPVRFRARAVQLRRDLGIAGTSDNRPIRESLERLCSQKVVFPLIRCDRSRQPMAGPLVTDFRLEKGDGIVEWTVAPDLWPNPAREKPDGSFEYYAAINIDVCAHLGSKYALRLYELASTLIKRRNKQLTYSLVQLRYLLGASWIGGESLTEWYDFSRRALTEPIKQINQFADFTIAMESLTDDWTGRVNRVRLELTPKAV